MTDDAPNTRQSRILSAMQAIASWPGCTAEAVAEAAIQADDLWIRERLMEFAPIDGMPLSQRDALIRFMEDADDR